MKVFCNALYVPIREFIRGVRFTIIISFIERTPPPEIGFFK